MKKEVLSQFGVEVLVGEEPINRLKKKQKLSESQPVSLVPTLTGNTKQERLDALRESIAHNNPCSLKKTALNLVFSDGNPEASIMLIGEAPGADEDRQGKPFVGMSGQLLTRIFSSIGLVRERDLYITNIVPWRPPGNRQPTIQEIHQCLPFVHQHIALMDPKMLILVGGTSTKALLSDKEGITKLRGTWFNLTIPGLAQPVLTTAIYHPAYLLRSPLRKKDVWMDLLMVMEKLKELNLLPETQQPCVA